MVHSAVLSVDIVGGLLDVSFAARWCLSGTGLL